MDFFMDDVTEELNNRISLFQNEKVTMSNNTQREINEIYNLLAYKTHQNDAKIRAIINTCENLSASYRDKPISDIQAGFAKNYAAELFEIAIFDLLTPFALIERPELQIPKHDRESKDPDFVFAHDLIDHQFECTATTPGKFDEYLKLLPNFDRYYFVAELIYTKADCFPGNNVFWECVSSIVMDELSESEKKQVIDVLEADCFQDAKNKFLIWISIIRHASMNYKDFINRGKIDLLNKVTFPLGAEDGDETDDLKMNEFLLNRIVRTVLDKLKKEYFHLGKPVTLAISISLIKSMLHLPNPVHFLDYLKKNLIGCLLEWSLTEKYSQENLLLDNLYAIIIDTCWYNWFPEIAIGRYGAKFLEDFNNCYVCIYNEDHLLVQNGKLIYQQIPYWNILSFGQLRQREAEVGVI